MNLDVVVQMVMEALVDNITLDLNEWSALFDELKEKESLSSDAKLAEALGVTGGYICSVRKGRKNVSIELAKTIFDRLGRPEDVYKHNELFLPIKVRKEQKYNIEIYRFVKMRARGYCQLCEGKAPFRGPDGMPYLEVHLIVPIREGGSNIPENMVALCPNCHQKIKISPSPQEIEKLKKLSEEYSKL